MSAALERALRILGVAGRFHPEAVLSCRLFRRSIACPQRHASGLDRICAKALATSSSRVAGAELTSSCDEAGQSLGPWLPVRQALSGLLNMCAAGVVDIAQPMLDRLAEDRANW